MIAENEVAQREREEVLKDFISIGVSHKVLKEMH